MICLASDAFSVGLFVACSFAASVSYRLLSIVRKKGSLAWVESEVPFKGIDTGNISPVYFCRGKRTTERKREICSPGKKMRIRCIPWLLCVYIYIYYTTRQRNENESLLIFSFFFFFTQDLNGIPENDKWIFVINPFLTPLTAFPLLKSKRKKVAYLQLARDK